ncbi:MAG TPA: PAS domain S-box protein, partial [Terriglobales bacterium]
MGRNVWRLFAATFALWAVAQGMGLYADIAGAHWLEGFNDILFFLSVIPFGALPFLDPRGESDSFDKIHILDFVQVGVVGVSILLSFSSRTWSADTAFEFGPFIWSRNFAFGILQVFIFALRALSSRQRVIRSFFLRMAVYLFLSGLADSYALHPKRNLPSGGWFDLVWSTLLIMPILLAGTWQAQEQARIDSHDPAERLQANRLLPLIYPIVSFGVLAYVSRIYPLLSMGLFSLSFYTFAVRVLIIQARLQRSEVQLHVDADKRKRVEETLRESEVQYRLLFESNPVPMWVFDRKTLRFLKVNEAAVRHYQYSREEFLAMTIDQIRPKDDVPALLRALEQSVHGLQEPSRWRHLTKSGEMINVEIMGHALQFQGMDAELIAAHDITERTKAAETAERLASIAEFSQDAIIGESLDGSIVAWNRGAEKMYGYTSAEVIGKNLSMLWPSDPKLNAALKAAWEGKSIEGFETQSKTKIGSLLDVSLSLSPIKDADGRIIGASTIARDVTLRKRSEEQLKLQSAALEAAANAIVITDSRGIVLWVNESFTQMTGYSRHEILGQNTRILKSGHQEETFYKSLWTTIMAGNSWSGELINRRKDGTTYTEEMTITPVTHESNGTTRTYFIAIKRDVTERRRSDETLVLKNALLEAQAETTIDGILVVNELEQIILTNKRFGDVFGIPEGILNRRDDLPVRQYMMDQVEDPDAFLNKVKYLYDHSSEKSRDELRLKNGKVLDRYSSPLVDARGTY